MSALGKLKLLITWFRARPLRTLVILLAIETLVFLGLLMVFLWLVLDKFVSG